MHFVRCDGPTWLEKTEKARSLWLIAQSIPHGEGDFPFLKDARVYLVGSALTSETRPRDLDIRVFMSNDAFKAHFGASADEIRGMPAIMKLQPPLGFWACREAEKRLGEIISYATGERMIDLAIHDEAGWERWYANAPHQLLAPVWDAA